MSSQLPPPERSRAGQAAQLSKFRLRAELLALRASSLPDRAFSLYGNLRSRLVWGLASDRALLESCGASYGEDGWYRPDSKEFMPKFFRWESEMIDRFFPPRDCSSVRPVAGGRHFSFSSADMNPFRSICLNGSASRSPAYPRTAAASMFTALPMKTCRC